jgi:hypothetical protein
MVPTRNDTKLRLCLGNIFFGSSSTFGHFEVFAAYPF